MSELAGARFQQLVEIMRTLRGENGCAWDRQQTVQTLRPFSERSVRMISTSCWKRAPASSLMRHANIPSLR